MGILNVLAAAVAAYIFGAIWYMTLAKPWMSASGVEVGEDGRPANSTDKVPYIVSIVCLVIVAGMMRHVFNLSDIDTVGKGLVSGLGIGLFLATPWIATNYTFAGRSKQLILIDGGYATIGCTVIGTVLTLF
ncbi:DUF1761 domain-containing protein [Cognatishimia activa]|uniref:DUF1761 domain-containing protein n=1 Tax=Cognatishimia activa TaxID=1715691 RepID=A0A0P1ILN3_9RHOB|nr:DUF1761 domain-containing protein [Cognatishimia activa]CUI40146.1 hypothetical protein TA5113_00390 [Cognatishimia activa]CUK24542.1 hypothetical protein TA5114_00327 [Cognatishimia activa]